MRISQHFSLKELTASQYADRNGIDNTPAEEELANLKLLVVNCLQPIRDILVRPLTVTSGFRCKELNAKIGGVKNSQHVKGQAVDIECFSLSTKELFDFIKSSGVEFDQLILEFHKPEKPNSGWVHLSWKNTGNRKKAFEVS